MPSEIIDENEVPFPFGKPCEFEMIGKAGQATLTFAVPNLDGLRPDLVEIHNGKELICYQPLTAPSPDPVPERDCVFRIELRNGSTAEVSILVNDGPALPSPSELDEIRPPYLYELPEISAKLRRCEFKIEGGADE